ncbi:MAG: family 43 glycosylhydrolase [Actinobacteria bacterium]|nr:family 43 glycosylhydrolase [Actinomycetota bacterium]
MTLAGTDLGTDATPEVEPQPPPSTMRARSRARIAALIVLLALNLLALDRARQVRAELYAQSDANTTQSVALADLRTQRDAVALRLESLRTDANARQRELKAVEGSSAVKAIESDFLSGEIQRFTDKARTLRDRLNTSNTVDRDQLQKLLLLAECYDGIRQASVALDRGDTTGTVAALKSVSAPCQQALTIVEPGADAAFPFDFPDPTVIYANGSYYAFATNASGGKVQVIQSTDLDRWTWVGEALGQLPGWAVPGWTWAPAVIPQPDGYYLYYSARRASDSRECISVAKASAPAGPYVDLRPSPIVCPIEQGGAIDPDVLIASDGTPYLYWKTENETRGGNARLWGAKLKPTFDELDGNPQLLLAADRGWEGRTVEGPSMIQVNDRYLLFYSANRFDTADYAEGYAVCDSPVGPCTKPADNVVLKTSGPVAGPGGADVFQAPGGQWFVAYHAWTAPNIGYPNRRRIYVDKLSFQNGRPVVAPK